MQESHKTKHRKVFEKSSTTRENCSKTDLQKQSIPRKTRSCSFRSGGQFKERKASRFHSRRRRLFDGKRIRRGNSAILRGNFRHRVDRRSGEEVRTPLRSMHYPRWGYVTITEVHSTRPLGSGITYTTPTINSPRPLKRSGGEERGQETRGVRGWR